jgi:hypothetical protein
MYNVAMSRCTRMDLGLEAVLSAQLRGNLMTWFSAFWKVHANHT